MGEVERFLEAQGLNARALLDGARQATATAGDALETARPTVDSTVSNVSSTLLSTDPVVLAEYAAGLVALYYLVRLRFGGGRFGGYPAKVLPKHKGVLYRKLQYCCPSSPFQVHAAAAVGLTCIVVAHGFGAHGCYRKSVMSCSAS